MSKNGRNWICRASNYSFDSAEVIRAYNDKLDMGVFSYMDSTAFVGAVFHRSCDLCIGIWREEI